MNQSQNRGEILFLYSEVRASQAVHKHRQLWIIVKKTENGSNILSAWCSCMVGSFETCNHVIATLYKIEYTHTKGWCNLACNKTAYQWNKGTRKEVEPKHITNLFVRKKLGSKHVDTDDEIREETRMKNLNAFAP